MPVPNMKKMNQQSNKQEHVEMQGVVIDHKAGDNFVVKMDGAEVEVIAKLAGKMRHNNIRVAVGDRVTVAFSPTDGLTGRGMITYRFK